MSSYGKDPNGPCLCPSADCKVGHHQTKHPFMTLKRTPTQSEYQEMLKRLVEWQQYMGGFDATVWREAERLVDSKLTEQCDCTCFECRIGTHCSPCMATL